MEKIVVEGLEFTRQRKTLTMVYRCNIQWVRVEIVWGFTGDGDQFSVFLNDTAGGRYRTLETAVQGVKEHVMNLVAAVQEML